MNKRVLLGMSGGVDSSVSAILLKEAGYEVIGVTMKLWEDEESDSCCNLSSTLDAKSICDFLEIPHYTINFKDEFKKYVVNDFVNCYKNCKTPNPCIECNKYLKFGAMYQKAKELNVDYIATGHYAKVEFDDKINDYVLKKSKAGKKDQSYVLYNISKDLLKNVIFPLGDFESKDQIRQIAKQYKLVVASKPDSEDICFIPDGDYKKFLSNYSNIKSNVGNIVNKDGKVFGKHLGLHRYTIGQRKGLGIQNDVPLYVIGFNKLKNELIVGEKEQLFIKEIIVSNVNWLVDINKLKQENEIKQEKQEENNEENNLKVNVKTRYAGKEESARLVLLDNNCAKLIFDNEIVMPAKGQSAVFYKDDIVLGGGKI